MKPRRADKKKRKRITHLHIAVGAYENAAPGNLSPSPDARPVRLKVLGYGPNEVTETTVERVEDLAALRGKTPVMWIDVTGTGDAAVIRQLGEMFDLHPLSLEDVMHGNQRAKVEDYASNTFIVLRMPEPHGEVLEFDQLSVFLGADFVLTVQEKPGDCFDPLRHRIRHALGRVRQEGCDHLAYALLDAVVDSFFPLLEHYSEKLEAMEVRALAGRAQQMAGDIHAIRYDLRTIRRIMWSTRELTGALSRGASDRFSAATRVFVRDCHDHTAQLLDVAESCRELASSLMDLYNAALALRGNEIVRLLTLISTVFIPLSFIASVYGMNFDTRISKFNMPELEWAFGYPFVLTIMAATAGTFLWLFHSKGWLGAPRDHDSDADDDDEQSGSPRGRGNISAAPVAQTRQH